MKRLPLLASTLIAASFALSVPVFANDVTWTGATDGTWDTSSANWTGDGSTTFTTGDNVTFDGTAAGAITLGEAITAGSITFTVGGYTISNGTGEGTSLSASSLLFDGARNTSVTIDVSTLTIEGTLSVEPNGSDSGSDPARVLIIGNGSTATEATAGSLTLRGESELQISAGSTLTVSENANSTGGFSDTISGAGTLIVQGTFTDNNSGSMTISVANFQATTFTKSSSNTLTFSGGSATIGTMNVNATGTITFEGGGEFTITGDYTVADSSSTQGASLTVGADTSVTMENYEAHYHQGTTTLGTGATLTVTTQMWFATNSTEELTGGTFNIEQLTVSNYASVSIHDANLNIGTGDYRGGLKADDQGYFIFGDNLTVGVYAGTSGENTGWSTTADIQFTKDSTGTTFYTEDGQTITLGGSISGVGFTNTGEGTLTLSGTVALESAIVNSGNIVLANTVSIALDGLTMQTYGESTTSYYEIITGDSGTVTFENGSYANFTLDGGSLSSSWNIYTQDGYLVIYRNANDLTWAGTEGNNTWDYDDANWSDGGATFSDGDNVTFDGSGYSTVVLGTDIEAGSITFSSGYTITNGDGTSLKADSITVDTDARGTTTTIAVSTLEITGTIGIQTTGDSSGSNPRVLVIGDGSNVTTATAAALYMQGDSELRIAAGSTLTVANVTDGGGFDETISGEGTFIVTDTFTHSINHDFVISIANFQANAFTLSSNSAKATFSGGASTVGTLTLGTSGASVTYTGEGAHTVGELIVHTNQTATLDYSNLTGSLTITKLDFGNSADFTINGSANGTITEISFTNDGVTLEVNGVVNVGTMNITTQNDMGAITIAEGATLNVTGAINVSPGNFGAGYYSTITGAGADKSTVVTGSLTIGSGNTGAGLEVKDTTFITGGINFEGGTGMYYLYLDNVTLGFTQDTVTIAASTTSNSSYLELGDHGSGSSTETTSEATKTTINTNLYADGAFTDTGVTVTIAEMIAGTGTLAVTGNGSLTLSGANTYTGGTIIDAGKVIAANNSALGTGDVTIENGGQLEVNSSVTISNNINIILSEANISSASKTSLVVTLAAAGDTDVYALIGSGTISNVTITITVDEAVAQLLAAGGEYTFDIYDSSSLTLNNVTINYDALTEAGYTVNQSTGQLIIQGLPEPELFSVFFGISALGLMATRRRRRKVA